MVVSRHDEFVERLRMAFEGAGRHILHVNDPLEALAKDIWSEIHVLLVDAEGDPMDGYRLCRLLRGETRILFRNLPIFLLLDRQPTEEDREALREVDGDGFIPLRQSLQQLLNRLGPVVTGMAPRGEPQLVPILAFGLQPDLVERARELLRPLNMEVHTPPARNAAEAQRALNAPVMLLGLAGGAASAQARLERMRDEGSLPHTILVGQVRDEATQRKLLLAGVSDWVSLPLSAPRLLHACKRAIEWVHSRRIQSEYESAIHELRERRSVLEQEATALRNEVLTDPLTELLNRRAFDQNLEHAIRQWERHRRAFVLLLADVDHFKLINDRFGHPVGDEVLRELAVRIRSALRKADLAFRIGGEEFAVLLTETSLKAGAEVAEKLRHRVDEEPLLLSDGQSIFPTLSFGVGGPGLQSPTGLLARVDQALYHAKRLGRNRVVVAEEEDQPRRSLSAGN
ncbi:diguanylate cyclase [Geothrix sp. 21YS21S-4]|uniref:GGDEF domain-containing protein n=1 Tax=Geothrix sp. 21YS21S-4 TaxID=3068889 RepID=UPI0027BAC5BA|nr:diguanylate cyclase [Geothrix sp. 21YS21S-4]